MSTPSRESAAIILDSRDHGESDRIITFFTQDRGRLTGIAKGANRSKKRFVNKLELFSLITITYNKGRGSNLAFIAEAELHTSFINLRTDVNLYTCASIIQETILMATVEHQGEREIYHLLLWALKSLDEGKPPLGIVTIYLLRLYDLLGYRPDLSCCCMCNMAISPTREYGFHYMTGGLICNNCSDRGNSTTILSLGTIKLLQAIVSLPLEKMHRLQFSRYGMIQSLTMLHRFGRHLFQREINSWKAVKKIMQGNKGVDSNL